MDTGNIFLIILISVLSIGYLNVAYSIIRDMEKKRPVAILLGMTWIVWFIIFAVSVISAMLFLALVYLFKSAILNTIRKIGYITLMILGKNPKPVEPIKFDASKLGDAVDAAEGRFNRMFEKKSNNED